MRILNVGLDQSALKKDSKLAKRLSRYGGLVDEYLVVVPSDYDSTVEISSTVTAYGVGGPGKTLVLMPLYKKLKRLITKHRIDLITVQDQYYLAFIAWLVAKKYKIALEIQVHGFEKFFGLRKAIAKFVISKADAVRTVSQRLKQKLLQDFNVPEEKINVVPIYTEKPETLLSQRSANEKFVFLHIVRLVPVKNTALLIEAYKKALSGLPNSELWIVGDGPMRGELEGLKNNTKEIKFFGWQENVSDYYNQANAFVLSSDSESWGLVIIEALYHGLPVVMTNVGCAGEVVVDDKSGVVVEVGNVDALSEAIKKIALDKKLRERLVAGGYEAVKKLPSLDDNLKQYKTGWQLAQKNYETSNK